MTFDELLRQLGRENDYGSRSKAESLLQEVLSEYPDHEFSHGHRAYLAGDWAKAYKLIAAAPCSAQKALTSKEFRYAEMLFKYRQWSAEFRREGCALVPNYYEKALFFEDSRTRARLLLFRFKDIKQIVKGKDYINGDESWTIDYYMRFESAKHTLLRLCASASDNVTSRSEHNTAGFAAAAEIGSYQSKEMKEFLDKSGLQSLVRIAER